MIDPLKETSSAKFEIPPTLILLPTPILPVTTNPPLNLSYEYCVPVMIIFPLKEVSVIKFDLPTTLIPEPTPNPPFTTKAPLL